MSMLTPFLKLFKWDKNTDGDQKFNIDTALNQNWDKIDQKTAELQSGYISIDGTITYVSWDSTAHMGTITIAGDYTGTLKAGMKLKLIQGTEKLFYVKDSITYADNVTTVPIWSAQSATTLTADTITAGYFNPNVQDVILCDW